MSWNPSPEVADCREIARRRGWHQCIIIGINQRTGTFMVNSYGETKVLCDAAGKLGERIHDMIGSGELEIDL
jgi:hypothetical protein